MKRGTFSGGRIVRAVIPRVEGGECAIQHFSVAIDDDAEAISAVLELTKFPDNVSLEVVGELRPGFIAIQSMAPDEVRLW
jgi:hypothetical protein